jgi:hypothetical protein
VINLCYVLDEHEFKSERGLHPVSLPPGLFYASYRISTRAADFQKRGTARDLPHFFWEDRQSLGAAEISSWHCGQNFQDSCSAQMRRRLEDDRKFSLSSNSGRIFRALDPFAGVGSFSLGLATSKCIELTHAIEIAPSTAETLRQGYIQRITPYAHADFTGQIHQTHASITHVVTWC